jgi:hypothetical protein
MTPRRPPRLFRLAGAPRALKAKDLELCARCGLARWMHRQYWAQSVGADHRFAKGKEPQP